VLVTRPIVALGKDLGYMPGGKEEKLGRCEWYQLTLVQKVDANTENPMQTGTFWTGFD